MNVVNKDKVKDLRITEWMQIQMLKFEVKSKYKTLNLQFSS